MVFSLRLHAHIHEHAGFSPKRGSAVMYRALTEKRRAFHRAALEQQRSWGAGPAVRARMLITQFYTCYALAFGMAEKSLISTYFKPSQGSTNKVNRRLVL